MKHCIISLALLCIVTSSFCSEPPQDSEKAEEQRTPAGDTKEVKPVLYGKLPAPYGQQRGYCVFVPIKQCPPGTPAFTLWVQVPQTQEPEEE